MCLRRLIAAEGTLAARLGSYSACPPPRYRTALPIADVLTAPCHEG